MNLVWKLLRQHISIPQLCGFFFANLFGMLIVLMAFQFYRDITPLFTSQDSFMKADYLIVSKQIGMANAISGQTNSFSSSEQNDLQQQSFVERVGKFTSTEYKVDAQMGVNGVNVLNSELFFESIPDDFVDAPLSQWHYTDGEQTVPIILPRTYITMYNFGFAQSHALPKLSEGLMGMIDFNIFVQGNGLKDHYKGKVIGFSGRLNTILVPQAFMDYANKRYAPGRQSDPTRLILKVTNPGSQNIAKYMDRNGYEVEDNKLNAEKATYFLRLVVTMVMSVGLVISILSFYILMLSIYLLVQKNADKLENLLLIGYSPAAVARPYQLLTLGLNVAVLGIALLTLYFVRAYYISVIDTLFPLTNTGNMMPSILLGIALLVVVSLFNLIAIRSKIGNIWKRKEL